MSGTTNDGNVDASNWMIDLAVQTRYALQCCSGLIDLLGFVRNETKDEKGLPVDTNGQFESISTMGIHY